ncbi:MAG: pstC [Pseudonocardiales bacterium]|nr:pstC [Pseudonocardiales bacterium]
MTDPTSTGATGPRLTVNKDEPPLSPPSIAGESVVPRGAGGDSLGDDPTAPPIDRPASAVVGSAQPLGVSTLEKSPVLGAGSVAAGGKKQFADRIFAGLASGASGFVIILVALVAVFLVIKAVPALGDDKVNFLTSRDWDVAGHRFGIVDLLWVTVIISILAMAIAVPISIGIALFITHYAPRRLARPVAYVIDLLAAIPSIVYGIWGIIVLAPKLEPVQRALYHLSGIPIFKNKGYTTGTIFDGGVVLAIMILPIVTAISRDVFERTPRTNIEAAWALGATKWEMVRMAVLPYGRPGVISGAMLGLGRALGETIALYLILSKPSAGPFSFSIFYGGETFASKIANNAQEFSTPTQTGAYIAAGLVLFVLTFVVNAAARWIVNRRREFS